MTGACCAARRASVFPLSITRARVLGRPMSSRHDLWNGRRGISFSRRGLYARRVCGRSSMCVVLTTYAWKTTRQAVELPDDLAAREFALKE